MTALALSMNGAFEHRPVLRDAVIEHIAAVDPRLIVDCTVGGAGHATALLQALPEARLIGLDRDPTAVRVARERLAPFGPRARVEHARFSEADEVLERLGAGQVDALLADFGVSSHQLDVAERGFSFRFDGPLDMRMDPSHDESAAELIAHIREADLAAAIRNYGEERHAKRVAHAIIVQKPQSTEALAKLVRAIVPQSRDGIDPATRTFQGLRMLVNRELDEIGAWLAKAPDLLADGGVVAAISFHSLEDRAVKNAFREAAKNCICPRELPICRCEHPAVLKVVTKKPIVADAAEVRENPRARSAKLRVAKRLVRSP